MDQKLNVWNETFITRYSPSTGDGICAAAQPMLFGQASGCITRSTTWAFFSHQKQKRGGGGKYLSQGAPAANFKRSEGTRPSVRAPELTRQRRCWQKSGPV